MTRRRNYFKTTEPGTPCRRCGAPISAASLKLHPNMVHCTRSCGAKARVSVATYPGISTGTAGAISELRVATDLMVRGYPVFRALSPACLCDLIVWTSIGAIRVEVRSTGGVRGVIKSLKDEGRQDVFALVDRDKITYQPELPPP